MNSALDHLTAAYTDSETEDHNNEDSDEEDKTSTKIANNQIFESNSLEVPQQKPQVKKLVSYNEALEDDEVHSDSEMRNENQDTEDQMRFTGSDTKKLIKPDSKLQETVTNITRKIERNPNYDLNKYIQQEKKFRNPSIYDKLIQYCGIDELGTNFPAEKWNPTFAKESYYEELAKAQKAEMDKHEKQKKENIKTEVISGSKRKSKWDVSSDGKLVATTSTTASTSSVKTTTVINAFGTLKKAKI